MHQVYSVAIIYVKILGRSSVVPVRETCAQVLSNILRNIRSQTRKNLILQRIQDLLLFEKHVS